MADDGIDTNIGVISFASSHRYEAGDPRAFTFTISFVRWINDATIILSVNHIESKSSFTLVCVVKFSNMYVWCPNEITYSIQ